MENLNPDIFNVSSDDSFQICYESFTNILLTAARQSFNLPIDHAPKKKIKNPTIKLIVREYRRVNRLLGALASASRTRTTPIFPSEPWVVLYLSAFDRFFNYTHSSSLLSDFANNFQTFLRSIRKQLNKVRYAEEHLERRRRSEKNATTQIQNLLHGGSSKCMYPMKFSSLPLAICPDPNQSPNDIVSGSEGIKGATVQYFKKLYHRTPRPPQNKPWMSCPSVCQIAEHVDAEPFVWPKLLDITDLRRVLSKGNSRPTPGPDGWEKWFLRHLSDHALKPVINLANYIITHSHFPDCVKTTNISTIHKKGPNIFLSNYRGIACNNFILNLPFAWLNHLLSPYLTRLGVVPNSQVATQPGVQGRDIISYVSQLECWARRENIPLYILQRDQKKGFDMLEPQGFYDAIQAYHLPSAIADLDRSSQTNAPYRIKTAHGFTDTFIVNGVTKQGGSLSPLKCTLTTSLSSRWLDDELARLPQPLLISSHQSRLDCPHIPADYFKLRPSMIEAMDDTLLPATSLSTLYFLARRADRFQATYGWETEWKKSALYIYNDPIYTQRGAPRILNMPSVSYSDPQADLTFNNHVPVITDHTTFLRVPINRPDIQFTHLRDLILNFHFPVLNHRLPLTALRRIISQQVISKIRPRLALQPIAPVDAMALDRILSTKIHEYLGFPFRFNTQLITQPLDLRGFEFPSIFRLNSSLTVAGLQRDLNHHIEPFRQMSSITLADWTCQFNGCINPLSPISKPTIKSISPAKIPFAWTLAAKTIRQLGLSFAETDLSYITEGSIGLRHLIHICKHISPHSPSIPSRSITNFERIGLKKLNQLGTLIPNNTPPLSFTFLPTPPRYFTENTRDWPLWSSWLQHLPSQLPHISNANQAVLLSRLTRRKLAEEAILSIARTPQPFHHAGPVNTFASDASTISIFPKISATHFAVVANHNAFAASISHHGSETGIQHGEAYGIVAMSLLASRSYLPDTTLYTDHQNSVNLLNSQPQPHTLKTKPGRSYYRWILQIWNEAQTNYQRISLVHCKAHTSTLNLPASLNRLADHIASQSHHDRFPPPPLPQPTFTMDDHTLFSPRHGFVETNTFHFIDSLLAQSTALSLDTYHAPIIPSPLFDSTPPPSYSYLRALSSFSAVVQLYLRSGQLDTSLTLSRRLSDGSQPWCRFGCFALEDSHHIFLQCPHFQPLRNSTTSSLLDSTSAWLDASTLDLASRHAILEQARGLLQDTDTWPAKRSYYYLGVIPTIKLEGNTPREKSLRTRLTNNWHTTSIRLAARIWGEARRKLVSDSSRPKLPRTSLSFPSHFQTILPKEYPMLKISFD